MTSEDKSRNLEAWVRFFKRNPSRMAHFKRLAAEMRGMPTDTHPVCCEDGCTEPTLDGNRRCHAHYIDAVL